MFCLSRVSGLKLEVTARCDDPSLYEVPLTVNYMDRKWVEQDRNEGRNHIQEYNDRARVPCIFV